MLSPLKPWQLWLHPAETVRAAAATAQTSGRTTRIQPRLTPPPLPPPPKAVAGVFAKFDADGSGSLGREELSRMGLDARKILASDGDGDGEITMEELAFYLDQQAAS